MNRQQKYKSQNYKTVRRNHRVILPNLRFGNSLRYDIKSTNRQKKKLEKLNIIKFF